MTASELDPEDISPDTFPLPQVQEKLKRCADILHNAHGFCVLHGLGTRFSVEHGLLIFLGLASYVGDKRGMQNKQGHMLAHITDFSSPKNKEGAKMGIHTKSHLPFHTDMGADILALQVRGKAAQGGGTFVAPAWSMFNDLVSDPTHLETLLDSNWPIQISKRQVRTTCLVRSLLNPNWPPPASDHILAPLFQLLDGKLMVSVDPARLGPQNTGSTTVPLLSRAQEAALDALRQCAGTNELRVHTETGDFLFINNWALMHRRESFVDDITSHRHLVRMWLRNSELGWRVPDTMSVPWLAAYGENDLDRLYPVEPLDVYPVPKYTTGSAAFMLDDTDDEE